ncbi:MAG: hypothetical protein CMH55_08505 [Myxococcales bacterium]|nr:hypothetical protein [Myxococcales bacterium]
MPSDQANARRDVAQASDAVIPLGEDQTLPSGVRIHKIEASSHRVDGVFRGPSPIIAPVRGDKDQSTEHAIKAIAVRIDPLIINRIEGVGHAAFVFTAVLW